MIRFLNVYYPTRTVILLLCEALIVCGSFVVASVVLLGPSTMDVLADRHGILKIGVLTVATILVAYYFDLYEPQQLSAPWEIYFRLLLVIGCLSLLLSLVVFMFPQVDIARYVFLLGLALVVTFLIMWRIASTIVALVGLLLFLPFFPFVALAIKLSSKGPIFFSQTRVGLENRTFK